METHYVIIWEDGLDKVLTDWWQYKENRDNRETELHTMEWAVNMWTRSDGVVQGWSGVTVVTVSLTMDYPKHITPSPCSTPCPTYCPPASVDIECLCTLVVLCGAFAVITWAVTFQVDQVICGFCVTLFSLVCFVCMVEIFMPKASSLQSLTLGTRFVFCSSPHNLVSDTGHKSAPLWFIWTKSSNSRVVDLLVSLVLYQLMYSARSPLICILWKSHSGTTLGKAALMSINNIDTQLSIRWAQALWMNLVSKWRESTADCPSRPPNVWQGGGCVG